MLGLAARLVLVLGPDPGQPPGRARLVAALGRGCLAAALDLDLGRARLVVALGRGCLVAALGPDIGLPDSRTTPLVVVVVGWAAVGQAVVVVLRVVVVSGVGSVVAVLAVAVALRVVVVCVVATLLVVQLQVLLSVPSNSVGVSALDLVQRLTLGYHCPSSCLRLVLVLQWAQVVTWGLQASQNSTFDHLVAVWQY